MDPIPTPAPAPVLAGPPAVPRLFRRPAAAAPAATTGRDLLLWGVAAMLCVYVWRLYIFFPVLAKLRPAVVVTPPVVLLWLANSHPQRAFQRLQQIPTFKLIIILVAFMFLSVPGSLYQGKSFRFVVTEFPLILAMFVLVASSVRSGRDVEFLAIVQLAAAALFSVIRLSRGTGGADVRLGTGAYDPNDIALMMVCTMPFAIYFLRQQARPIERWLAAGAFAVLLLVLVKTASRGGFLGFVVMSLYILFHYRAIGKRAKVTAVTLGVIVTLAVGSDSYWDRIETILHPQEDYNFQENVLAGRMAVWERGVGYMLENPLLGVGVECFGVAEGNSPIALERAQQGQGFKWSVSHNSFVQVGAELGVIALIVYVGIFVVSIKAMTRIARLAPDPAGTIRRDGALAQALVASLLAFMVSGFFLSQAYYAFPFSLFGMVVGLVKLYPQAASGRVARGRSRQRGPSTPLLQAPSSPQPAR